MRKKVSIYIAAIWLNMFNAELSLKRHRLEPRSQEVGEYGDYT